MCWTFSFSLLMVFVGFSASIYLWYKKQSKLLWIPLIYFTLMEVLQALTYLSLSSCSPFNQILTYLSYLHIIFQPFFINALMLYFIPEKARKKIIGFVFTFAFIASIFMLIKIYPFEWAGACNQGDILCGENLCSLKGHFHLQWSIPFNAISFGAMNYAYAILVFLFPFIYGSWKTGIYNLVAGPILAYSIIQNPNEWPAIWCLLSIAYMSVILIPKFRDNFKVKKWYFWKYPFR